MVNDGSNMKITSDKGDSFRSTKSGPSGKPKRDFRKVMAKEEREGRENRQREEVAREEKSVKGSESYEDVAEKLDAAERTPKKKGVSLFDLAGVKEEAVEEAEALSEEEELLAAELSKKLQEESLSALFKGYGSKEKLKALQREVDTAALRADSISSDKWLGIKGEIASELKEIASRQDAATTLREPMEDLAAEAAENRPNTALPEAKGSSTAKFAHEQPDLSGINPLAGAQTAGPMQASQVQGAQQARAMASQMKEIVDQIISKLYTVNTGGKTDTLIKLRHPPLFAGANVVITSFESAKGEFNITFENLTQAAKQLLDMRENQEALKFALDQKGYTVHIITTTTLTETQDLVEGSAAEREAGEKEKGDSQKDENEKREEQQE